MKDTSLSKLIDFCKSNKRVVPRDWHKVWKMLPNRKRKGGGWEPSLPLILAAWNCTTEEEKQERFFYHLKYADIHDVLDKVSGYLSNLLESEWYHLGEAGPSPEYYYSHEIFKPKEKPSDEMISRYLMTLQDNWTEIAGKLIAKATEVNNFSGKKARRLNVKVMNDSRNPDWGSWWSLKNSDNPKSFTDFRAKINENIYPHSIDHIVFFKRGKRSK